MVESLKSEDEAIINEEFENSSGKSQIPQRSTLNTEENKGYSKCSVEEPQSKVVSEVLSALESIALDESEEFSQQNDLFGAVKIETSSGDFSPSQEYEKKENPWQTPNYDPDSAKVPFYDAENQQELEIKENVYEEIKSNKVANTFNVHNPSKGDPSLAKKSAQELYKTINFTMNTVLYDLVEV